MIEIKGFNENPTEPPATDRSVVVFFNDGSIIVVPEIGFNPEDKSLKQKANSYMYFPEGDMQYYIWAVIIVSSNQFNRKTVASINNEKLKDSDYINFFKLMGIKYQIIDSETISLKAPAFNKKDIDQYIIKGRPWLLGLVVYMRDNLDELGTILN
jgi:hypothetical protein